MPAAFSPAAGITNPAAQQAAVPARKAANEAAGDCAILMVSSTASDTGVRVAHALASAGSSVTLLCPSVHVGRVVPNLRIISTLRLRHLRASLLHALQASKPHVVLPCDDCSAAELHAICHSHPNWRPIIRRSLGEPSLAEALHSRAALLQALSTTSGVNLPEWRAIRSRQDLTAWLAAPDFSSAWVLKLESSGGGAGVRIVRSAVEAHASYAELVAPRGPANRLRCAAIDALFGLHTRRFSRPNEHMVAQRYISGRAANAALFCHNGAVLASVQVEVLDRFSEWAPSASVRHIQHAGMQAAVVAVARRLRLSGFHGIDFILEDGTDCAYLLELNPRLTPTSHLAFDAGSDLIAAAARAWHFRYAERPFIPSGTVALFPRQLIVDPSSIYLRTAHTDLPHDSPELAGRLVRRARQQDLYGYMTRATHRLAKFVGVTPRTTGPSF